MFYVVKISKFFMGNGNFKSSWKVILMIGRNGKTKHIFSEKREKKRSVCFERLSQPLQGEYISGRACDRIIVTKKI